MSAAAAAISTPARRTFVLCPWTTLRGNSTVAINLVQDAREWLDLEGYNDATIVIDVAEVTNPTGAVGGYVLLFLESSPTPDEAAFKTVAGPVVLSPTTVPLVVKTASAGAAPLARYLRWRLVPTGPASVFDATFRINVAANRSRYYAPTQLSGCVLWLRADLGASFTNTSVSGWADQSGNGNNASQGTAANQPTFSQTAVNGFAAIQGNGNLTTPLFMTTSSFTLGTAATFVTVVQPAASIPTYARIIEHKYNQTYYIGVNAAPNAYKWIANNNVSPFGTAEGGTISTGANTIVSGMFVPSGGTGTGTLYVNGSSVASGSFTTPSSASLPLYLMRDVVASDGVWNGYLAEAIIFNRNLTTSEFIQLHRYLGARYGVSVP